MNEGQEVGSEAADAGRRWAEYLKDLWQDRSPETLFLLLMMKD
jgi:hypothetical protein